MADYDPYDKDGNPRRFVGVHRPPIEDYRNLDFAGFHLTGKVIYGKAAILEAWGRGEFDRALYED